MTEVITLDLMNILFFLILSFSFSFVIKFGIEVGSVMSDRYLYYKNRELKEKIKKLEYEGGDVE